MVEGEPREKEAIQLLNMVDLTKLTREDVDRIENGFIKEFVERLFSDGKAPEDVMHQNHSSHSNHSSHTNHHNTAFWLKRQDVAARLQGLLDDSMRAQGKETPER